MQYHNNFAVILDDMFPRQFLYSLKYFYKQYIHELKVNVNVTVVKIYMYISTLRMIKS